MSDAPLTTTAMDEVFAREILPLMFPAQGEMSAEPAFVLLTGQPGASAARALGRVHAEHGGDIALLSADGLRAFHPRFRELLAGSVDEVRELSEATAGWLRASIAFAREQRRSLALEGSFGTASTALAIAERFRREGFRSRIVMMAVSPVESRLSTVSHYLRSLQSGRPSVLVSRDLHDRGVDGTRALAAAAEGADALDRFTVIDRSGAPIFDAEDTDGERPFAGAATALRAAQSEKLTSLQSTQWLSELHHVTAFADNLRRVPKPLTEQLIDLHEIALREVIPDLPVLAGSRAAAALEQRTASRLVALRRSLTIEPRPDLAAPVLVPGGPDRSGPSR